MKRYVHGAAVDDPIVEYSQPTLAIRTFLHADHQGSVVARTDSVGNLLAINRYDQYGIPAAGNQGRFGHTGQAWIPELGLWHYKSRAYSPALGRFLQVDTVGYEGGQINLYAYVGDDPANRADPKGTEDVSFYTDDRLPPIDLEKAGPIMGFAASGIAIEAAGSATLTVLGRAALGGRLLGTGGKLVGENFGKLGTVVETRGGKYVV